MVAKIVMSKSIAGTLNYNEKKVEQKLAECIHAANFLLDHDEMNFAQKRERFQKLNVLRVGCQSNTLHAFISFSMEEKLDRRRAIAIADEYMIRIGFGKQPYLVYQHLDTKHRHFHIVSTTIRRDGSAIDTKFIGIDKSNRARLAIEQKFGLIRDQRRVPKKLTDRGTQYPQKLQYGKMEMVKGMTDVLENVLTQYKYTSLSELNALLYQYNLKADPGKPGSHMYQNKGLIYKTLNEKGQAIGVPITASSIFSNANLAWLEKKFLEHEVNREPDLPRMRTYVELAMRNRPQNFERFKELLKNDQIQFLPYMNREGRLYDLMFIDHRTKTVAAAGSLGKAFTAEAILERMGLDSYLKPLQLSPKIPAQQINPAARLEEIDAPGQTHTSQDRAHTSQDIQKAIETIRRQEKVAEIPLEQRGHQMRR